MALGGHRPDPVPGVIFDRPSTVVEIRFRRLLQRADSFAYQDGGVLQKSLHTPYGLCVQMLVFQTAFRGTIASPVGAL